MADLNPFSKVLQKHAGRAKERLLQNLGKADRTTDEDFDLHVKNFTKQQNAALRLYKEFKNYHQCLRAMQSARRGLMDTVCELYEPCWDGLEQFMIKAEVSNKKFEDFCDKMNCEVLAPVGTYVNQLPDIINKISKRKRKLLDYDNARHNLQNLESMKKREDAKIIKAKEQLDDARCHFEIINSELHDELPTLYDSRVSFFATHLQCLFLSEADFRAKDGALFIEISSILKLLNEAYERGEFAERPTLCIQTPSNGSPESKLPQLFLGEQEEQWQQKAIVDDSTSASGVTEVPKTPPIEIKLTQRYICETADAVVKEDAMPEIKSEDSTTEEPSVLYQVRGTYKYIAEDADELSFNVEDIIDVVAYDDPEEQEEGWLMGVFNGKKGLFPANFTSRI